MNINNSPTPQHPLVNNSIFSKISSDNHKVRLDDIYFIKGYGDYMQFNLETSRHLIHTTMTKVEKSLPNDKFYRLHRSYIVRLDKIEKLYSNSVIVNGTEIPISKNKKQELIELLPKFH